MKCDYCKGNLTLHSGQYVCDHCGEYKQSANTDLLKKQITEELLKSNTRLIYKQVWHYAHKYNMDFHDLKSQAYLIFCVAVESYRVEKGASFTTHLFNRLRTLNDYCLREMGVINNAISYTKKITPKWYLPSIGDGLEVSEELPMETERASTEDDTLDRLAFYEAVDNLSRDSQEVVCGLLWGEFGRPDMERQRTIGKYRVKEIVTRHWGWTHARAEAVWEELKGWWQKNSMILVME